MLLFDTHCHLQDAAFAHDWDAAIARAQDSGVAGMTVCGYDAASNETALRIADGHEGVFPAVGFHPHETDGVTPGLLAELEALAGLPEVVAVGELGLDFYRDLSPREIQRRVLDAQLGIALRLGKPVSVHSRNAESDVAEHLLPFAAAFARQYPGRIPGVMHCFGGTAEEARPFADAGFLISVTAAATYPKNTSARQLALSLPLEALVIETDSPYLPPQTMRGKRNEPAFVAAAAEAVAAARGVATEMVAAATTANAERVFNVRVAGLAGAARC